MVWHIWSSDTSKVFGGGEPRMGVMDFKINSLANSHAREKKMKALFTPLELTFHKPCSAGKFPEAWRKANRVPKNVKGETRWS